jgi:hypothetical protein
MESFYRKFRACAVSWHVILGNIKIKICRNTILSAVLYGCEIWSLTLMDEYRVRVCEERMLRRIFGSKRGVEKTT